MSRRKQPGLFGKDAGFIELVWFDRWWALMLNVPPHNPRMNDPAKCRRFWDRNGLEPIGKVVVDWTSAMKQTREWRDGYPAGQYQPGPYKILFNRRWETPPGPRDDGLGNVDPLTRAAVREGNVAKHWEDQDE